MPATFDANGNQTTSTDASGTTTYTWDARNRLIARTGPGISESYAYDALGRRISKTMNGVTRGFLYDGQDIVQEIGGSAVGASYVRSLNIDEPFIRQTVSGNEFYHTDALGSTLALSNGASATQTTYTYEPFGKTTISGSLSFNPFQYTSRENDGTGLYYYRARYYSPLLHRFFQEDQFAGVPFIPETLNRYAYVRNDPISYRDPSGQIGTVGAGIIAGGAFGVIGAVSGLLAQGVDPFSDPATFFAATTLGLANGLVTGALIGAGLPPAIAQPVIGALNSGLSNLISQTISGRKPINVCSVAGATFGGFTGGALRAALQANLFGAPILGSTSTPVTNAIGSALTTAAAVFQPLILSGLGKGACP